MIRLQRSSFVRGRTRRLAWFALAASLLGCGSHASEGTAAVADKPVAECDAYVDAYRGCMNRLSPQSPGIAAARADNARRALDGITDNTLLRKACVDGLAQLQTSCH